MDFKPKEGVAFAPFAKALGVETNDVMTATLLNGTFAVTYTVNTDSPNFETWIALLRPQGGRLEVVSRREEPKIAAEIKRMKK